MTQKPYEKEFTLKAFLQLGGEPVELSGTLAGEDTVLAVTFKRLSLEKIINDLIQMVRPTYRLQLPFPWDRILVLELKDIKLSYNIKKKSIGFDCEIDLKVAIPHSAKDIPPLLELIHVYIDARSVHDVTIQFDGTIFGKSYAGDEKLGWNLVGADGPPTPPPPPSLFELKLLGMGQHLRLINAPNYEHVIDAIGDMASLFEPPKPGTLIPSFSEKLVFDNNSNWLFGLDAEIMGTVALSIVFNDPSLYGLFIRLKGEKAKSLAGLEFEILYKKITDDIGVFQTELKLPANIRNMEFGTVSVTLPQIGIDIYTNGNFKIDFGFPRNLNFASSFALQAFPYVGFGGFYFAALNGATSSTVPVSQNGTFNPVLEFGIGLQLGIGKTIDKGVLQASATLTYVGVVEGTLAWFNANEDLNQDLPDFYYRLSGTFAIVGKIWGGVHFSIVSASLDLTVYASATVVIEACEPIRLSFSAGVSVSLKVKIDLGLFSIHIRLSFHTTISYQFSIGSSSNAQWKPQIASTHSPAGRNENAAGLLEPLTDKEENVAIPMDWDAVFSGDPPEQVDLYYFTQFSAADAGSDPPEKKAIGVGMLFAPVSDKNTQKGPITRLSGIHNALSSFEQIAVLAFCWALNAAKSQHDPSTTTDQLLAKPVTQVTMANILYTINQSEGLSPFSYRQIVTHLESLFVFNIKDKPDNGNKKGDKDEPDPKIELHLSLFPMIPDLYFAPQNQPEKLFSATFPVDKDYLERSKAIIHRFSMGRQESGEALSPTESESLTTFIFCDYFQLLIKALAQSARDAMQSYKFTIPAVMGEDQKPTLHRITRRFTTDEVSPEDVRAIAVSNQNNTALLKPGAALRIPGIQHSIEKNDSIAGILETYGLLEPGKDADGRLSEQLFELNGDRKLFAAGESINYKGTDHVLGEDDTLSDIIEIFEPLADSSQKAAVINSIKDRDGILQVFRQIGIPTVDHTIEEKETLLDISSKYQVKISRLADENRNNETILNVGKKIIIENLRSLNIGELLTYLYHDGALGHAAGMASRFFMHGLRLPRGMDGTVTNQYDGLYSLSGQQFIFDFKGDREVTLSKRPASTAKGKEKEDDTDADPLPWVTFNAGAADTSGEDRLVHQFLPEEIDLAENYQGARFSPTIEQGPLSVKLYNDQLKTFTLNNPIFWHTETTTAQSQPGIYPGIWLFPPALRSIRHQSPSLHMVIGTQPQKNTGMQEEIIDTDQYNWCTLLPVTIRKAPKGPDHNGIINNTYEVYGTDAAGITLLTELVRATAAIESTHILFPSDPDNNEANALQSYDRDKTLTLLINTNLSTETNPDTLTATAENDRGIASTSPHDMVVRLWKASLVRTGGYYLYLRNREGKGLPDNLFAREETAEIYLLINYHKTDVINGYMNSVCVRQPIDAEHSVLFAQWIVPLNDQGRIRDPDPLVEEGKIARIPAVLPGNAGFKLVRTNPNKVFDIPEPDPSSTRRYAYQLEIQYNLLDFRVIENSDFKGFGDGLAVGPEKDHSGENVSEPGANDVEPTDLTEPWKYKRIFPIEGIIKTKPAEKSAYLGLDKKLKIGFTWRDNYGNRFKHPGIDDLEVHIKYFDYLIPLSQWPNIDISYAFIAEGSPDANFQINFLFHAAGEYAIGNKNSEDIDALIEKAQADLDLYKKSLDQISQDDVRLSFTVSMTPDRVYGSPETARRDALKSGIIKHAKAIITNIQKFIEEVIRYQGMIKSGEAATEPKIEDVSYHWSEHVVNTNKEDIFPLEVEIDIRRSGDLIDPAFKYVSQVNSVKTSVKPKSGYIRAEDQEPKNHSTVIRLNQLAENFEKLYPGMKVGVAYTKGKQQQEVWVVRFKSKNGPGIGVTIHHDQALFYAPQPLSTHLVNLNQVDIYSHTDYGIDPSPSPPIKKSYTMVDPETWAMDYLETIDTTLRPEFSIAINMFDTLLNKDANTGFLYSILKAKQKVAEAVAFQTIPILEDQNMQSDGLGTARERLKQQLLINLVDGYNTRAVVQYNVDVVSRYPDKDNPIAQIAPNLFGHPYVDHEEKRPHESSGTQDSPNYSLSTGKIALKGSDENNQTPSSSYLTFLFNTQTERDHSEIPLKIDYKINHLEFDIRTVDDLVDPLDPESINQYSVSKWLSFVKPFEKPFTVQSPDVPITPIPIPIRQYPKLPNWNSQQFIGKDLSREKKDILSAKQMDYTFSYSLAQFTAQDTIHFEVLFNSRKVEEGRLVRKAKPTDELDRELHRRLAQFSAAKDSILNDLRLFLPQVKIDMAPGVKNDLKRLLSSYDHLADKVATAWYKRFDPDVLNQMGETSLEVIKAKFDLEEGEDREGRFRITLAHWSVESSHQPIDYIAAPMAQIDGYKTEAWGYDENSPEPQSITDDNRYQLWVKLVFHFYEDNAPNKKERKYLSFSKGKSLLKRTIRFADLDILLAQNAWAGLHVVRNAKLSSDKPTSEEFIYTTPMKRFPNPVTPMLDVSEPMNIADLLEDKPSSLNEYLYALVENLLMPVRMKGKAPGQICQPATLKIVTSYRFSCNPDMGAVLQPCFLIPPTLFEKADTTGDGTGIKLFTEGILEWFEKNRPVQDEGRLYFDITFYSLMADNDLPVLRLRQLFIDVEKITTLKKFAG